MRKSIFLGALTIGLIGLSLSACARKKETVPPPVPAYTQPIGVQQAPPSAPAARTAGNLDYVKK